MADKDADNLGLFQRGPQKIWFYRFQVDGQLYYRTTKQTDKRKARKIAEQVRAQALTGTVPVAKTRAKEITLSEACARYHEERPLKIPKESDDRIVRLARIAERLGPGRFLSSITMDDLLKYQTRRRRDGVAPRTLNRDVPETLRPLVKHAKGWGVARGELGESDFNWNSLRADTPAARTRFATRREKFLIYVNMRKDYRPMLKWALFSGLRLGRWFVTKDQINWELGLLPYVRKHKKAESMAYLPLPPQIMRLLRAEAAKSPEGIDEVFTFVCSASRRGRKKGERYPITYSGFTTEMRRVCEKIGIKNWRAIHDLRHTMATDTLRATKDISALRDLLGHSDIKMTEKYAHVLNDHLLAAMSARRR